MTDVAVDNVPAGNGAGEERAFSVVPRLHASITFSALDKYGSLLVLLLSLAVLSRLLTPREIGISSLVAALMWISQAFGGVNCANYLIQKKELSQSCIRTAFTVTLCTSFIMGGVLFSSRNFFADFFNEDGLRTGIAVTCVNLFTTPFWGAITALLRRDMKFGAIAVCSFSSNLVIAATSVSLAALGYSFMGPIWGSVAGSMTLTALCIAIRRDPGMFRPCVRDWRNVVSFGSYSSATVLSKEIYLYAPQVILGRMLGLTAVGLYGRAVNVTQVFDKLIIDVLNPVIMPAFAAQSRAGADLKRLFLDCVGMISALHWPALITIALLAHPIVRILFGSQWDEVVPLVRLLSIASLSTFSACLTYPILVAVGRVRDTMTASLISVVPSILVMMAASQLGVEAVAASALLALPLQAFVALSFIRARLHMRWRELAWAVVKSVVVAGSTTLLLGLALAVNNFDTELSIFGFFGAAALAIAGWWVGLFLTRHPLLRHLGAAGSRAWAVCRSFGARARAFQVDVIKGRQLKRCLETISRGRGHD